MAQKNNPKAAFEQGYEEARRALLKALAKAEDKALKTEDPEDFWLGWNAFIRDNAETLGL